MIQLQVQKTNDFSDRGATTSLFLSKVFRRQYCILYFQGVTGVLLCPGFSKSFMGLYCTFMGDRGATASWFL